jgi:CheY-like chemotaxis protein
MCAGEGKQILIVEDHPESEELLRMILEEEGYRVLSVETGREAIRKLAPAPSGNPPECQPDLILMDMILPDLDGVEVVRELRQERAAVPPVVFLSANPLQMLKEAASSVGAAAVRKPFDFDDLFQVIETAIANAA